MQAQLAQGWLRSRAGLGLLWRSSGASTARGVGSIPGQGTKVLYARQCGQINKNQTNQKEVGQG